MRSAPVSIVLVALAVWSARRLPPKLWAYGRVLPRARRNRADLLRYLIYRPGLLGAVAAYESAVLLGSQTDVRLKALAFLKTWRPKEPGLRPGVVQHRATGRAVLAQLLPDPGGSDAV